MAELWALAGCLVHPARADGTKVPVSVDGGSEDVYPAVYPDTFESGPRKGQPHPRAGQPHDQAGEHRYGWKRLASGEHVYPWSSVRADLRARYDGIGVFCGPASGELEMLELEGRAVHELDRLAAAARELGVEELWERLERGCSETSPSGGVHWFLRVADGPANGNTKLAMRPDSADPKKPQVIAETRGAGGWVVVAGSFGRTHGSGKPYRLRTGSPLTIPRFTAAERDAIYAVFRTLDELPEVTNPKQHEPREIARRERPDGVLLPGEDFDQRGTWHEVFPSGWARISSGGKADGYSMHGAGGRKTADLYHESGTLYVYDTDCAGSQRKLTKFSALAWLQYHGDFAAAASALYAAGYGSRIEKQAPAPVAPAPALRVEQHVEPDDAPIPLERWRSEASAAVGRVVERWQQGEVGGWNLLAGEPGTGKTYATAAHTSQLSRGVTSAPSHELCGEIVEQLRELGADAAAYPRLDATTCRNWEQAQRALSAGLPVAACVCNGCPFKSECRDDGYLAGVRIADRAPHKVVTHERLARTAARLTKRAEYVVLEEDPSSILRPSRAAGARALASVADLVEQLVEAERRAWILDAGDLVVGESGEVEGFSEFEAWAASPSPDVVREVEEVEQGDDEPQRQYGGGFLGRLGRVADLLAQRCRAAVRGGLSPGMHEVKLPPIGSVPRSPEWLVWRALEALQRIDPHGVPTITAEIREALTVAVYAACGRFDSVYVQVEQELDAGSGTAPPVRSARVVGYWRVDLPAERMPVFVNDGTCSRKQLEQLTGNGGRLGLTVRDITPAGRVEVVQPCTHYAVDVLPSTSPHKVARILAGIVRAHPDRKRVGVVLLKRHHDRLLLPDDDEPDVLPADVRDRIEEATYYGAGDDRGSNRMHRRCDLVIVLGTFRPPPREIRRRLVQLGEFEAANVVATWGAIERHAVDAAGEPTTYRGRGYAEEAWAAAADSLTRSAVRQAAGRARAICPDGAALVVCSTERLGLPVADAALLPMIDERIDRVISAVADACPDRPESHQLASKNPNTTTREIGRKLGREPGAAPTPAEPVGATLDQIVERLGVPLATARKWIARAVDGGQLVRSGRTWQTRYTLAAEVEVPPTTPAPLVVVVEPEVVVEPAPVSVQPEPPPPVLPVEVQIEARVEHPVEHLELDEPPEVEVPPIVPADAAADLDAVPEERWWPWLASAVDPDRFPREREDLRFVRASQAWRLGNDLAAWESECTPELVPRLAEIAGREARRRGDRPPPVEVVARHTTAWALATLDTWGR